MSERERIDGEETDALIAVVSASCRFPDAATPEAFFKNLCEGLESVRELDDEALVEAGVRRTDLEDPAYVKAGVVLDGYDRFDPEFFGMGPREAAIMDPQHRLLLECAWEALESAGHPPERFEGPIGVFAGCGMESYFMNNVATNPELVDTVGMFLLRHTGNDKDFLATRVSYCLDLHGPSINIQTACSTSLVAIHYAASSLLSGECDMALAGGVTIELPHGHGYRYAEGEILSPDGHCRAFDAGARGTVFGSGAGIVVLRRLADALADGDPILAVLRGSAVNNDGSGKVGYLAPSVDGQAAAVAEALAVAGIDPRDIGYVEAHGTGTPMGDPIEVAALTQAFRSSTDETGFCALGSVKPNIGHLDTAAGVAGFIKACEIVRRGQIPPSLHFREANPELGLESTPFFVSGSLAPWQGTSPRRALVNSLGVGGTNACAVLEEPPARSAPAPSTESITLLPLSAKTPKALRAMAHRMSEWLAQHEDADLSDVSHTLDVGRRRFAHRGVAVARSKSEAATSLSSLDPNCWVEGRAPDAGRSVAFLLPGGGAQYPDMARGLYRTDREFAEEVDRGLGLLEQRHGLSLASLLFPEPHERDAARTTLERPSRQLPLLFVLEHALAKLWERHGVTPDALIGHSMGENTAACLSGVLAYEDALGLVALRGALSEEVRGGAMLSVELSVEALKPYLTEDLDIACENAPELTVVSGPKDAIAKLEARLGSAGVEANRVAIDLAAHSRMLEPVLGRFEAFVKGLGLSPPKVPIVSNRTGHWLSDEEATSPEYWVSQFRNTVLFHRGIETLLDDPNRLLLEVGPGRALGSLARRVSSFSTATHAVVATLRHPDEDASDEFVFRKALGKLWALGTSVDFERLRDPDRAYRRLGLPTYPFQRQRYFLEPASAVSAPGARGELPKIEDPDDRYLIPVWTLNPPLSRDASRSRAWVVFEDEHGLGKAFARTLRERGCHVVSVRRGEEIAQVDDTNFIIDPERGKIGFEQLALHLVASDIVIEGIAHFWLYGPGPTPEAESFHRALDGGLYTLTFGIGALSEAERLGGAEVWVFTSGAQSVGNEPLPRPERSLVLGPVRVLPHELPGLSARWVDLPRTEAARGGITELLPRTALLEQALKCALTEIDTPTAGPVVAWRGGQRFEQRYETARSRLSDGERVAGGGVHLITGGLGGIGLTIAKLLARRGARLALVGRAGLPERREWDAWIERTGPEDRISRVVGEVRALEEQGAEVLVLSGDVANVTDVENIVAETERRFGRIDGVCHAAGVLRDALASTKTTRDFELVLGPKVHGLRVLEKVLGDRPLSYFVTFSSTSTVIGPAGQVDYVAANAYLDAVAHARRYAGKPMTSVKWGVWTDVGMARRMVDRGGDASQDVRVGLRPNFPLFRVREESEERFAFVGSLSAETDWVVDDHRTLGGHAVLPGTAHLQLMHASARELGMRVPIELSDVGYVKPLVVLDGQPRQIRVVATPQDKGFSLEVQSLASGLSGNSRWEVHAVGYAAPGDMPHPEPLDRGALSERMRGEERKAPAGETLVVDQARHLGFGPRFQVLRGYRLGQNEALLRLELGDGQGDDLQQFPLHPGLLDIATGGIARVAQNYDDSALWVPMEVRRVRVHQRLTSPLWSHLRSSSRRATSKDLAAYDATLMDEAGNVLIEVDGLTLRRIEPEVDLGEELPESPGSRRGNAPLSPTATTLASPAEMAFRRMLASGITQAEGTRAFERVVTQVPPVPEVAYTTLSLDMLEAEARAASGPSSDALQERPELEAEYAGPADELEAALVEIFETQLGVRGIGVRDGFFDLGGHSLIAVRTLNTIKKQFAVELPLSVLFEAPSVELLATRLRAEVKGVPQTTNGERAEPVEARRSSAVPIQPNGYRTPVFCVAGMGGNPLNLRHLAIHLGQDRPFFGLQHRGVDGKEQPHVSVSDMAAEYLRDIKRIQPRGPYLLGGFSGGGTAAYELAQQLRQEGEEVALVFFLDSICPAAPMHPMGVRARTHLSRLRTEGPAYAMRKAKARIETERRKLTDALVEPLSKFFPYELRNDRVRAAWVAMERRYMVAPYDGPVVLFRVAPDPHGVAAGRALDETLGWGPFAQELTVFEVPGEHETMCLEPSVRTLAQRLAHELSHAELRIA